MCRCHSRWALVPIILFAFWIRVILVAYDPLFVDELFEVRDLIPQPLVDHLVNFRLDAQLPHVLLTRPMTWLGWDPFLLRWPSLLIGVSAVPLAYQLGRRLFNDRAGVLTAALFAALPVAVSTSIMIRGYSLVITLSLACSLFLAQAAETRRLRHWLLFGAGAALLIFNHAFSLLFVAAVLVYLVWRFVPGRSGLSADERNGLLRGVLITLTMAGATLLGMLAMAQQSGLPATNQLLFSDTWTPDLVPLQMSNPLATVTSYLELLRRANFSDTRGWHLYYYGLLVLLGVVAAMTQHRWRRGAMYLPALSLVPILLTTAAQAMLQFHAFARFLDFALPAYVLLAAFGIWWAGSAIGRSLASTSVSLRETTGHFAKWPVVEAINGRPLCRTTAAGVGAGLLLTGVLVFPACADYAERYALGRSQQLVKAAHYLREHATPDDIILYVARDDPQANSGRLGDVKGVKGEICLLTLYFYPELAGRSFAWQEMSFTAWQNLLMPGQRCASVYRHHPHPTMDLSCEAASSPQGEGKQLGPHVWLVFWQSLPGQSTFGEGAGLIEARYGDTRLLRVADSDHLAANLTRASDVILSDDRVSDIRTIRNRLAAAHLYASLADTERAKTLLMESRPRLDSLDREDQRSLIKRAETLISYLPYLGGAAWPEVTTNAIWDDQVRLRGYTIDTTPASDGWYEIVTTLFWQAMRAMQEEPTFFIHWQDSSGRVLEQADSLLYNGHLPSALWSPGSVMRETRTLHVPAPSSGSTCRLVVGIYNVHDGTPRATTGDYRRLPLRDDQSGENVLALYQWRKD